MDNLTMLKSNGGTTAHDAEEASSVPGRAPVRLYPRAPVVGCNKFLRNANSLEYLPSSPERVRICLVGNAPSSGSTWLADLLDSTHYSGCGVETGLFANRRFYDFSRFQSNVSFDSKYYSVDKVRVGGTYGKARYYGLADEEFQGLVRQARTPVDFARKFALHYLAFRGKALNGVFFEKTPANLNCLDEFLTTFRDAHFIHLVRNPLYVYRSLRRRGYSTYVAWSAWLLSVGKYLKYQDHPRIILLRYEDLVRQPFRIVSGLLGEIGNITVSESEISQGYATNHYRCLAATQRHPSWTYSKFGVVGDANSGVVGDDILRDVARAFGYWVNEGYAREFNLAPVSMAEAIHRLGYYDAIYKLVSPYLHARQQPARPTSSDRYQLFTKWYKDMRCADTRFASLPHYLEPLSIDADDV